MKKFIQWFTTERRQLIQAFLASLTPLLIMVGFGTEGTWEQVLIITGATMQFVASLLNLVNLRVGDWGAGWAIIRGAIYTLGTTVAPALVILGWLDEATSTIVLTGLSLALGALSSAVAIFTGGQQQLAQTANHVKPGATPFER